MNVGRQCAVHGFRDTVPGCRDWNLRPSLAAAGLPNPAGPSQPALTGRGFFSSLVAVQKGPGFQRSPAIRLWRASEFAIQTVWRTAEGEID